MGDSGVTVRNTPESWRSENQNLSRDDYVTTATGVTAFDFMEPVFGRQTADAMRTVYGYLSAAFDEPVISVGPRTARIVSESGGVRVALFMAMPRLEGNVDTMAFHVSVEDPRRPKTGMVFNEAWKPPIIEMLSDEDMHFIDSVMDAVDSVRAAVRARKERSNGRV